VSYKGKHGTYRGDYGRVMCQVEIDGDDRKTRNIWKSSITLMVKREQQQQQQEQMTTVSRQQHTELLNEIRDLSAMAERLKLKVEDLG